MISDLLPFSADSIGFAGLAAGSVLVAWSSWRRMFLPWMVAASAVFLATWLDVWAAGFLFLFLIPPYFLIRRLWNNDRIDSLWPITGLIVWQVCFFVIVKGYTGFEGLQFWDHPVTIIGLSYLLFRQLHLIIEAGNYPNLPLTLPRYLVYTLSFWTLLAGPIQRYPAFCEGLQNIGRPELDAVLAALHRGVNGALKAFLIAPIFLQPANILYLAEADATVLDGVVVLYAFPVYLYLNFSGYTDLVIALARLCGMNTLPENFNRPYLARNIQDFWGRWHLSFSHWIRDYIFMPLNMAVHRKLPRPYQNFGLAVAVIVTFVTVGAWHGTTIEFFIFGILHGLAVLIVALWGATLKSMFGKTGKKKADTNPVLTVVAWAITFNFVCLTLLLMNNSADEIWCVVAFYSGAG